MTSSVFLVMISSCNVEATTDSTDNSDLKEAVSFEEIKSTEEQLLEFLDTTEYVGMYDVGYDLFQKKYNCDQSDSIINCTANSKLALYAFYNLTFGDDSCSISSNKAIELIEKMTRFTDTIGVWTWVNMRGEYLPYQAAANSIWENNKFPLDSDQKSKVGDYRGY